MYKVLESERDKYGYQTAYIDPKQISKLTLDDVQQWSVIVVQLWGDTAENCYEFTIPLDKVSSAYYKNKYKSSGIDDRTYVLRRNLVKEIQDKVNYCYKRQKELGEEDDFNQVQVILYRWNPMKKETTGAIREMKGTKTAVWGKKSHRDELASALSKNFRKML